MDRRSLLRAGLLLGLAGCSRAPAEPTGHSPTARAGSPPGEATPSPRGPSPGAASVTPDPVPEPVQLTMVCRDAWGAAPAGEDGGRPHAITGLMVHHAAVLLEDNRQAPGRMRGYQRYHQEQGWPDVAYHVGVDRNGNVYELRDPALAGDTFTSYDPAGWLLVLADGHFDEQQPSPAQLEGVAGVLAWGVQHFGTEVAVAGHRDHARTTCPGDHLYAHVADGTLQARVVALLDAGGVALDRVCGPAAEEVVAAIERGDR